MGIKTLTEAREILLLACGEEKAAAVFQMLYAKTTSYIPAAYLCQKSLTEVTVYPRYRRRHQTLIQEEKNG